MPIPGAQKLPDTICASFAATGRGWRHPTFTCRRPAPGRRARWLEIQGPVPTGSGESASNGGGAEARLQWLKADAAVTGSDPSPQRWKRNPASARGFWPRPKRTAKEWHGSQDAAARVPKGSPLRRAKALHWLRSRRPRHPSHPRRHRRRGWPHCTIAREHRSPSNGKRPSQDVPAPGSEWCASAVRLAVSTA